MLIYEQSKTRSFFHRRLSVCNSYFIHAACFLKYFFFELTLCQCTLQHFIYSCRIAAAGLTAAVTVPTAGSGMAQRGGGCEGLEIQRNARNCVLPGRVERGKVGSPADLYISIRSVARRRGEGLLMMTFKCSGACSVLRGAPAIPAERPRV